MIDKVYSDKLMLALEPEAAAIHCQTLAITDLTTEKDVKKIDMIPNTTYMIIDAGGAYISLLFKGHVLTL